ncbi:transmembrane protein 115 [Anopheles maculipalpis]|uniref:transmembrane protein 115 n=1 Tax=Anopheles maculipalpis TaxID=1496333 RepID=UPI0021593603|nr:transmembrane protein 115 [Anopheles maculipalpis]
MAGSTNALYIRQQMSALLGSTSTSIKFICIATLVGYMISFSERISVMLCVTPGYLMPPTFWVWTIFTYFFIEQHYWEVLVDLVTVGLCGKLIEPSWGQMEMLHYFAITNTGVAILTSFYYLFYSMITKDAEILFNVRIYGLAGMNAAISVAVTQIMPDHLIARTPLGKFSNRNVPLTVVIAAILLWACGLLDGTYPAMFASGLYVSWVYLRFYQRHSNGTRGDSAENFRFASFFPNVLQPFIAVIANPVYLGCLRIGLVKRLSPQQSNSSSLQSVSVQLPGVDPHDMERRRQIALKALSERLSKTTDSSRQNTVPKSFPQTTTGKHHHHGHHHHGHGHGHGHSQHQQQFGGLPPFQGFPMTVDRPAIALPPPPSMIASSSSSSGGKPVGPSLPTNPSLPSTTPVNSLPASSSVSSNLINLDAVDASGGSSSSSSGVPPPGGLPASTM